MRFIWVCLLSSASACALGPSREEKSEAGALSRAIDLVRRAPNADKAPLLSALEATACERPPLCALKTECLDAYRLHVRGLEHEQQAKTALTAGTSADTIGKLLEAARDELTRAAPLVEKCTDHQAAFKRSYKLQ